MHENYFRFTLVILVFRIHYTALSIFLLTHRSYKRLSFNGLKPLVIYKQKREREILPNQKKGTAEVFVDASLQGWGGVIVWETDELEILGSAWPADEDRHINVLEADALWQTLKGIKQADHLTIWVDNTTVCGAFRKRMCVRSHILNKCLLTAIECLIVLKCSYSLAWVSTKYNPADIPSREEVSHGTRAKVEQALGSFFNWRSGGGAGVPSNRIGPGTTPAQK